MVPNNVMLMKPADGPPGLQTISPQFDSSVAHSARVYGYWLGSKDHYLADRKAAEEVASCRLQVVAGARANRGRWGGCSPPVERSPK
jgi:hypothetical protein